MKPFKEIFGRIWALWGLIWLIITILIASIFYIPCLFLKDPASTRWHRHASQIWMVMYLTGIGCPIKVYHKEVFQKGENYVIVANHNSLVDVFVTTPFMPQAMKTIAKKSFAKIPILGWIYSGGSVLVDRADEQSRVKSFIDMKHVLDMGLNMLLFPEGTRNRTGQPLKSFYNGAFRLAKDTGKSIIPVVLLYTREILPVNKTFYMMPHKIEMHFLPAVSPEGISAKELRDKIYRQMWDYYEAHV